MERTKLIIERLRVVTLGPKGTISEEAGNEVRRRVFGKLLLQPSWDAVAEYAADGEADLAVMAHYNTISKEVKKSIDAQKNYGLRKIPCEDHPCIIKIPVKFAVGEHPENNDRSKVYSFENALIQCTDYLDALGIKKENREYTDSTAAAAEKVFMEKSGLAIAKLETLAANGLRIINEDITNKINRVNETSFHILRR